jgi:DNA mismatch endonuclease, patch repair protein
MADVFSTQKRSDVMSRIGSKNTIPELRLRKALHRQGYRFRLHVKNLTGKPDIVFPKYHTVIQVRGCFWHGHNCIDGHLPKSNAEYWKSKLLRNKQRDRINDCILRNAGWAVIVVWECAVSSQQGLSKQVSRISRILQNNS